MRNRFVQIAISLAMLGLLVQIVLVAPSQIRDSETKAALLPHAVTESDSEMEVGEGVDQSMKSMHMIETQEGRKEWELSADRAKTVKGNEILHLANVKAIFFSDSGTTFTVTGEKGLVEVNSKNLHISGNVVTRSSNGYVFRTESMQYASKDRLLTAENRVEMTGPRDSKGENLRLTGVGMRASLLESNMEILSDVRAQKGLEHGRQATIRSHRSLFSGKNRTAKFLGNVVLDMDAMRITGPEAEFAYDSSRQLIKTANFTGGARVSDAQKWATAQNVDVDFEANRFVFRGSPRVVQGSDELRGQEIVFIDGGKRVQVKGARADMDQNRVNKGGNPAFGPTGELMP